MSLSAIREKAVAGDRFLLCSDGLTRTVPESQIEVLMERADIGIVVQGGVKYYDFNPVIDRWLVSMQ